MRQSGSRAPAVRAFSHEALLYRGGPEGFADALAPQVAETLDGGGAVAVAALEDRLTALRSRVGVHDRLALLDMRAIGANPARIIPVWRELAEESHRPFLGIGEPIWSGRDHDTLTECHRHEALINVAFTDDPGWRLVCPYDVDGLDPEVVENARRTHPLVHGPDGAAERAAIDAQVAFRAFERPLAPPPEDAYVVDFDLDGLEGLRDLAGRIADGAGFPESRRDDLLLAVTEAAGNSVRHGGGGGRFAIWTRGRAVVAETVDAGRLEDPLVGRRRPTFDDPNGRGFWLMHQVCDLVQVRSTDAGTTVRLTVS
jgi:anti-sigma regulatory factor (Ser/Thr protein kinase)